MRTANDGELYLGSNSNSKADAATRRSHEAARSRADPRDCSASNSESAGTARSSPDQSGYSSGNHTNEPDNGSWNAAKSDRTSHRCDS